MPDIAALLAGVLGRDLGPDERLAVAVSGGPDSVALLLLAAAAFPGRVAALTVDHGLRAAAASEAAAVARQCTAAAIPHVTLSWTGAKPRANLQAAARAARYALMAEWCVANATGLLLTAHHADDQAETLLMRLVRGSGGAGLAGIRGSRGLGQGVTLVRPLLGVRRAELAGIAAGSGWTIADDPGNRDPRFARTHARQWLADNAWLDVPRIAAAAAHLADAEAALAWTVDRAWAGGALVAGNHVSLAVDGLPAAIAHRLVGRAIAVLAPESSLRGADLARLVTRLQTGGTATLAGVRARGGAVWHFTLAPKRRQNVAN